MQQTEFDGFLVETPVVAYLIVLGPCPERGTRRTVQRDYAGFLEFFRLDGVNPPDAVFFKALLM